jgi:hypothetical protein
MTSLIIDPNQLDSDATLPNNISLTRASVSLNFLLVDHGSGNTAPSLFLYNYDPKTYNTWYPPFHFRPWSIPSPATTYRDLRRALNGERPAETQRAAHLPAAIRHVEEMLLVKEMTVQPDPLREEIWLKFSKSQQQWTLYEFAYFRGLPADRHALRGATERLSTVWLPLVGAEFDEAVRTERFQGIPIVDNVARLLRDPAFISEIVHTV